MRKQLQFIFLLMIVVSCSKDELPEEAIKGGFTYDGIHFDLFDGYIFTNVNIPTDKDVAQIGIMLTSDNWLINADGNLDCDIDNGCYSISMNLIYPSGSSPFGVTYNYYEFIEPFGVIGNVSIINILNINNTSNFDYETSVSVAKEDNVYTILFNSKLGSGNDVSGSWSGVLIPITN